MKPCNWSWFFTYGTKLTEGKRERERWIRSMFEIVAFVFVKKWERVIFFRIFLSSCSTYHCRVMNDQAISFNWIRWLFLFDCCSMSILFFILSLHRALFSFVIKKTRWTNIKHHRENMADYYVGVERLDTQDDKKAFDKMRLFSFLKINHWACRRTSSFHSLWTLFLPFFSWYLFRSFLLFFSLSFPFSYRHTFLHYFEVIRQLTKSNRRVQSFRRQ